MARSLRVWLTDPDKIVKANDWMQEITNPIFFVRDGVPTSDGLFSNEIFGIAKTERSERFGYITLGDWFITPHIYKLWTSMDRNIRECVHGTKNFKISTEGYLVEDEKGDTGLSFLKKNINKIKIRSTGTSKRDTKIDFINENKDKIFIQKMLVIPAFYRDVDTSNGYIGVGEINKLYNALILGAKALKETDDYGLPMSNAQKGRMQETLKDIYDWFTTGATSASTESGSSLKGKFGLPRRAVLSKTTDYASRLVLSAPNLKVERIEDMQVDMDHVGVPLAAAVVDLYPFILFYLRRFFENNFVNNTYTYIDTKGTSHTVTTKNAEEQFSDNNLKKQIDRFIHGYSNRFIPVTVILENGKEVRMNFKGRLADVENRDALDTPIIDRHLTWCDLIFQACIECCKDKYALITRYPMDTYFGQYPMLISVMSTKNTVPMWIDNTFYPHYPDIKEELLNTDTSSTFVDTLCMSNCQIDHFGADYDGDTVTCKIIYSDEANVELKQFAESKSSIINLGGNLSMGYSKECIQAMYSLTVTLSSNNITKMDW